MRKRSVSITGVTGFVGWHLAEAFRDAGWGVRAIARQRPGPARQLPDGIETIDAPLEASALRHAISGTELLVHCAGVIRAPSYGAFAAVNVEGTRAAVEAANATGARVLLVSSQAAAGPGTIAQPRREDAAPQPVNDYGRSKLAGEEIVRHLARTPWTIIRPCAVYGPRDRGFLPIFRLAKRGLFVLPMPRTTPFMLIEVHDLARCVVLAAESPASAGQAFFAAHPLPRTTDDIMSTAAACFGTRYRPVVLPRPLVRTAAALGDLSWQFDLKLPIDRGRYAEFAAGGFVCSVEKARDLLGFTAMTPLDQGFARTAEWLRQHGAL